MAMILPEVPAISAADIKGALAILPTPSVPGADHWSCEQSVNLDETARMVARMRAAGLDTFITAGSFGEGASLTRAEHCAFTDIIARTLGGHGMLFAGVTTMNTRDTISLARDLVALGATGIFLGRPMWMSLDATGILRFYRDVAEALPRVPIMVYDNQFAFKAKIDTATYAALSGIRQIIATKHIGGPSMAEDLRAVAGRMRVLPVDSQWAGFAQRFPEEATACWSGNAADGAAPLVMLAEAVARRDWPRALHIGERMWWAQAPMFPGGKLENFVDYNVPIAHARLEGSGLVKSGPPRPPYTYAPEGHLEGGRETGRRWASLTAELRSAG